MQRIRIYLPTVCLALSALSATAQISKKGILDAGTGTFFSGRMLRVVELPPDVPGLTSQFADSLRRVDQPRMAFNFGIHYVKPVNNRRAVRVGINLADYGFRRIKSDIRFGEWIHPEIGVVADNSQTGPRDVYYDVRYRQLEVPITFLWNAEYRNPIRDLDIHIMAGIAPGFLTKHETVVRLRGFTTSDGLFTYHIQNTGYKANPFNVALLGGVRIDYVLEKRLHAVLVPTLRLPVLNSSSGVYEQHRSWQFGTEIGLSYRLNTVQNSR
jgi:hypothetical protein